MSQILIPKPSTYVIEDLAERFRVSVGTIRGWLKEGKLPKPLPFATRKRWDAAAFERWLAEQTGVSDAK
jgi:hypothetical protein